MRKLHLPVWRLKFMKRYFWAMGITIIVFSIGCAELIGQEEGTKPKETPKVTMGEVKKLLDQAQEAILAGNEAKGDQILNEVVDLGYKAWNLKETTMAETIFRQILKLKPDHLKALFGLAELYRMTNPLWAIDYYTKYLQSNPGDAAGYFGRGTCYLQIGSYTLAIQDLKYLVTRLAPDHIEGLTNLALALRGKATEENYDPELYEQAIEYMKRAVDSAVQRVDEDKTLVNMIPELKYRLGRLMFEYQQVLARAKPEDVDYDQPVGILWEAVKDAENLLRENPRDEEMVNKILLCYDALTEVYSAKSKAKENDVDSYLQLAKLTEEKAHMLAYKQHIYGLFYLEEAVKNSDKTPEIWYELAKRYVFFGMGKEAIEAISKARTLAPQNAKYKRWESIILSKFGKKN